MRHDATASHLTIAVRDWHRDRDRLTFDYAVGDLHFSTSLQYHDVDLLELEHRHGAAAMRTLYWHIAAFDVNKLASLGADAITFGPFADLVTEPFVELWRTVVHHVWAQWRFEHDRPTWPAPVVLDALQPSAPAPLGVRGTGHDRYLAFCGGGKDSLVAGRLLEGARADYDAFVYASSDYGDATMQHGLVDRLLAHLQPSVVHRLTITEDFLSSSVLGERPELGVHSLTAAETPASIFAALPIALANGHRWLVLGHERSADAGNLRWAVTGEDVNHQWGKSTEAERLLDSYVRNYVIGGLGIFSILKPIHDVTIFGLLAREPFEAVRATHSCNVAKPWCKRCAKCLYVWLGLLAYLDEADVAAMFGEDLAALDDPAAVRDMQMMAGLAERTPFECIGQVEETRLAIDLCRAKGLDGPLFSDVPGLTAQEAMATLERFMQVDATYDRLPEGIRSMVHAQMRAASDETGASARELLHLR